MQNHHLKTGFSLIELLVYMAIFSIVSGFIWQGIRWIEEKNDHLARKQATIREGLKVFNEVSQLISELKPQDILSRDGNWDCLEIVSGSLKFLELPTNSGFYALKKYSGRDCTQGTTNQLSGYVFKAIPNPPGPFFEVTSLPATNPNEKTVKFINLMLADKTSEYSLVTFKFRSKYVFNNP